MVELFGRDVQKVSNQYGYGIWKVVEYIVDEKKRKVQIDTIFYAEHDAAKGNYPVAVHFRGCSLCVVMNKIKEAEEKIWAETLAANKREGDYGKNKNILAVKKKRVSKILRAMDEETVDVTYKMKVQPPVFYCKDEKKAASGKKKK